jgi:hypothetical protein
VKTIVTDRRRELFDFADEQNFRNISISDDLNGMASLDLTRLPSIFMTTVIFVSVWIAAT